MERASTIDRPGLIGEWTDGLMLLSRGRRRRTCKGTS